MDNNFDLLDNKSIISILDGDESFGDLYINGIKTNIRFSLPYLSEPTLCDISNNFGLDVVYGWNGGAQSRWMYLSELLQFCNKRGRTSELLSFLFSKRQFEDALKGQAKDIIDEAYQQIVDTAMQRINGNLYFKNHELVKTEGRFFLRKIGSEIEVVVPSVKTIDRSYISELSARAIKNVEDGNFDSAITKSRTLLEEVFCYVIEKKGQQSSTSGDIGKLYNQVKELYGMQQSKDVDKRVNNLLSGLEKILTSIAEMRNIGSDSHGVGERRVNLEQHHARLFVNSAMVMAEFILSVGERQCK